MIAQDLVSRARILMAVTINWYFHDRGRSGTSLPAGAVLPESNVRVLEETSPLTGPVVIPEDSLRPESPAALPSEEAPETPAATDAHASSATKEMKSFFIRRRYTIFAG